MHPIRSDKSRREIVFLSRCRHEMSGLVQIDHAKEQESCCSEQQG